MKDRFGYTADEYRNALNDLELALTELGISDLVSVWGEPRLRADIGVKLPTNAGAVYRLHDAYMSANRMMNRNADEF